MVKRPGVLSKVQICELFSHYSIQKTPETPNLSKICPSDCFLGVPARGTEIWKNLSKFENGNFWTYLGFRAF